MCKSAEYISVSNNRQKRWSHYCLIVGAFCYFPLQIFREPLDSKNIGLKIRLTIGFERYSYTFLDLLDKSFRIIPLSLKSTIDSCGCPLVTACSIVFNTVL